MTANPAILDQPRRVYAVLVPVLVASWFLSEVGGDRTASDGGLYYVGAGFWLLFGIALVVTLLFTLVLLVRRLIRQRASA